MNGDNALVDWRQIGCIGALLNHESRFQRRLRTGLQVVEEPPITGVYFGPEGGGVFLSGPDAYHN